MNRLILLILLLSSVVFAEVGTNINAAVRTDPRAKNLTATIFYDYLLHGRPSKETPFYGYARAGATIGGSPTLGAFLQVAPVAPLIFEIQKSRTIRFDNADRFDCETNECQGVIDRVDYIIRGVVGFKDFFFSPSYMWREIQTNGEYRPVYIEQEVFMVSPGFHRFQEASAILGYTISEARQTGLIYTENVISENRSRSRTTSAFYRFPISEFKVTIGVSHYKYEQLNREGPAAFLTLDLDFGQKLSLF